MAMFARVVEARSFTAAALRSAVSKSVVSKRITALEKRLGVRLLHRSTRRLSLTSEGTRLYERCLHMLRTLDEAAELVQTKTDEPVGVLRVNSSFALVHAYLADAITRFLQRHPRVQIELSENNAVIDLISERVDVAVRVAPRLDRSSLVTRRLATAPKVACASPAYLRERGTPRVPEDLRGHACLRYSPPRSDREWRFLDGGEPVVVPVSGPLVSDSVEALRRAAVAGAGIILQPRFLVRDDLDAGRLVPVLASYDLAPLSVFALYVRGELVPAKIRAFVDHLDAELRHRRL